MKTIQLSLSSFKESIAKIKEPKILIVIKGLLANWD